MAETPSTVSISRWTASSSPRGRIGIGEGAEVEVLLLVVDADDGLHAHRLELAGDAAGR